MVLSVCVAEISPRRYTLNNLRETSVRVVVQFLGHALVWEGCPSTAELPQDSFVSTKAKSSNCRHSLVLRLANI